MARATKSTSGTRPVLTGREGDVLLLLGGGCSHAEIALRLGISVHTVATHVKNCYRKLGVRSAAHAVTRAHELDLMPQRLSEMP
ncbi:MAG TPA: helix-turn-helix transcriptional regulator [Burkholderiales bacterium]|nr:helix-turn-helix transcriptional regulator [Burkholderiales bacterium]